jgi:hypothetical protein
VPEDGQGTVAAVNLDGPPAPPAKTGDVKAPGPAPGAGGQPIEASVQENGTVTGGGAAPPARGAGSAVSDVEKSREENGGSIGLRDENPPLASSGGSRTGAQAWLLAVALALLYGLFNSHRRLSRRSVLAGHRSA